MTPVRTPPSSVSLLRLAARAWGPLPLSPHAALVPGPRRCSVLDPPRARNGSSLHSQPLAGPPGRRFVHVLGSLLLTASAMVRTIYYVGSSHMAWNTSRGYQSARRSLELAPASASAPIGSAWARARTVPSCSTGCWTPSADGAPGAGRHLQARGAGHSRRADARQWLIPAQTAGAP